MLSRCRRWIVDRLFLSTAKSLSHLFFAGACCLPVSRIAFVPPEALLSAELTLLVSIVPSEDPVVSLADPYTFFTVSFPWCAPFPPQEVVIKQKAARAKISSGFFIKQVFMPVQHASKNKGFTDILFIKIYYVKENNLLETL